MRNTLSPPVRFFKIIPILNSLVKNKKSMSRSVQMHKYYKTHITKQ